MNVIDEYFPIINRNGEIIGKATRKECHSGSMLLHPVVHLHIFSKSGSVYLQKRSLNKDIQPGKWDTAVGGHVDYGESIDIALLREAKEELGLTNIKPHKLISYVFQSNIEQEQVNVFCIYVEDDFFATYDSIEIDDARFWSIDEIESAIGCGILTPNFEQEFERIKHLIHE